MSAVTIYADQNFQGASKGLDVGRYNSGDLGIGNDKLTSLRVASGYKATLFSDGNFSGSKMICVRDTAYVGPNVNDKISSIIVEAIGTPNVILYEDGSFQGWSAEIGPGSYNGGFGLANDHISSVIIPSGYRVRMFVDGNFSGAMKDCYSDQADMGSFNDAVSSIIVDKISGAPQFVATVYDAENFEGGSQQLVVGRYNVNQFGLQDDTLSSIKVASGFKVTLYTDANYSGSKVVCVRDTSYIGSSANDRVSSIVVEPLGTPNVIIYTDENFCGWSQELAPGRYDGNFGLSNDAISSAIVPEGYRLVLYKSGGFTGSILDLYKDASSLGDLSDETSSLVVEKMVECPQPTLPQLQQLIAQVAPRVYLHPTDEFGPSSVEWFLDRATLKGTDGTSQPANQGLPQGGGDDGAYWLEIPTANRGGDLSNAVAYVNAKYLKYFVDLQFWFFYPYNGAGRAKVTLSADVTSTTKQIDLDPMGEHGGDWEHATFRVRLSDGVLISVYLAQHSGGVWLQPSDLAVESGSPVVYSSRHGHASYRGTGHNLSNESSLTEAGVTWFQFGLINATDKGSRYLDCRSHYQILGADWLSEVSIPAWRSFNRRWGPHIVYDRAWLTDIIKGALGDIPVASDKAATAVMDALPDEFKEENGPTGPWRKGSWSGDE